MYYLVDSHSDGNIYQILPSAITNGKRKSSSEIFKKKKSCPVSENSSPRPRAPHLLVPHLPFVYKYQLL